MTARVRGGFRLEDRRGDPVHVQDARERQAAETGTDDGNWSVHRDFFFQLGEEGRTRSAASFPG